MTFKNVHESQVRFWYFDSFYFLVYVIIAIDVKEHDLKKSLSKFSEVNNFLKK